MATVSPSLDYTLRLPRDPRSPGVGRATLRAVLAAHDLEQLSPVAELLATELLTNAHQHTTREYALRVVGIGGRLRVGCGTGTGGCRPGSKRSANASMSTPTRNAAGGSVSYGPAPRTGACPCCATSASRKAGSCCGSTAVP